MRRKSRQDKKSLNQTAIEILQSGLALNGGTVLHNDLDFMIGSWIEDPAFNEAMQLQDHVDQDLWR